MKPVDLDAVRELVAEATPGPWRFRDPDPLAESWAGAPTLLLRGSDAQAAAAFSALVPAMADEIEALRSKLAAAESAIEDAYLASSTDYALHIARILDPVRAERFRLTGVSE